MTQTPSTDDFILKWRGDTLTVTLKLDSPRAGRAAFRTNIGRASVRRHEIIDETEKGITPLAKAWTDIPLAEVGPGLFRAEIPLEEVGVFSGKACFFPAGSPVPEWPEGRNTHIKVESAETRRLNAIYTVFPRQFGSFREIVRRLPLIMDTMGFRLIQTLPPFPVPTTYAVMGEYGSPFAATDFLSVDPAMAEFDECATPLMQFKELIGAVHSHRGLMLLDLPANHTGWASTLQTHHPDWFNREADGRFVSPGAWGVTWADLVQLDYANPELRAYMADVFVFWCRLGVDGFRCDAGYMIPAETWNYIVARVREEYPDTIFMLEGLGGEIKVTDRLLAESNLDWAYSEIFQTYDRNGFEWYLPQAIARAEKYGTLVHFAETHDNDRLAKGGETYARLRVQLAALLSWQGAWGIANGVEWYCREKIDVHQRNDLNWGAKDNMVDLIARLNAILATHPSYAGAVHQEVVTRGDGNTLAVLRTGSGGDKLLILANLDCGNEACIDWDRTRFSGGEAFDLIVKGTIRIDGPVHLAPGEVKCVSAASFEKAAAPALPRKAPRHKALFHVVMPRDAKRDVVVPQLQWVELSAPSLFRMRVIDPATGRTIRVCRSEGRSVTFDAPHYYGDGTRCRRLELHVTMYEDGKAERLFSNLLIPPTSAKASVKLEMSKDEVRLHPDYRTVLSNGVGASAQVRVGWGTVCSQYDAILAANPNPTCPSDRVNLWSRARCWLQREGYTRELDRKCVTRFVADPSGAVARWEFCVPCGMGRETAFVQELSLVPGENTAVLKVTRVKSGEDDVDDRIRLVFRPDLEWRSFHSTTKAFKGLEQLFPSRCRDVSAKGCVFAPYDGRFTLAVEGGEYHHEPQWDYNVGHPEEAARGQDGSGDLFSPGWISADLPIGGSVTITGSLSAADSARIAERVPGERIDVGHDFAAALKAALSLFIVRRDDLKTVIAGYPWFLDWGRDTFIFMRGMIAAGMHADALKILKAFAAFEENGTLPNIIYGKTAGNRDTTDAQLWFIRCVQELQAVADPSVCPPADIDALVGTCLHIVDHYVSGTPNGIRMDSESGLVWSPAHFTWMDTNYPACTPRIGYPVEIQALWISALRFLGREELAEKALASVKRYFKTDGRSGKGPDRGYCDCLAAPCGEPAAQAIPEDTLRPNQLFLITLGILDDPSILEATEQLLIPGGIRSLAPGHVAYRGVYAGDEDTSRKPAYHNGTAWAWVFPLYAEAMAAVKACPAEVALQLLAGAVENLNTGCIGHISEIADGDAPHAQKGCAAQAWSVSELLRVWLKLKDLV